jgi:hypothetical protein
MRKYILLLSGLLFIFAGSGIASAKNSSTDSYGASVDGKRARKNLRHLLLAGNLKGDKKCVFDQYGYTPHRLRFSHAGQKTERWRYYEQGLEFVFDESDKLVEWRQIQKEDRRIR